MAVTNKPHFPRRGPARSRVRGMSLIELMVAAAVGLVVTLAVTGSVLTMGRQFQVLGSNVSAQSSAQIGLSLIDAAGRSAGAGFYNNAQLLCATWNAHNGTAMVSDGGVFMPARIADGGAAGTSDAIVFTAGGGTRPLSALPVLETVTGNSIKVSNAAALASGDYAVLGVPGSETVPCTLFQVNGTPTTASSCGGNAPQCQVLVRNPNDGINPNPTAFATRPNYGFDSAGTTAGPSVVSRVGSSTTFRQEAFAVQCNALVRYNAFVTTTLPGCTASPLSFGTGVDALASDVVLMHAQYGISTSGASDVVTNWVDASGSWGGTLSASSVARIKAVRVVLVARSREAEGTNVSAACTNANGVVNTGPCSFQDASAPVIDVSGLGVPAGRTWQNYRYRVHKAVIPLRTVIWSAA